MTEARDVPGDGLAVDTIGSWSVEKHRLVAYYDELFSTGMKDQWDELVYLDLFCGPGHAKIQGTNRIVETSPLIALKVPNPFSRYVFCDRDGAAVAALEARARRECPDRDVRFHRGDCNKIIANLLADIPMASSSHKVLSLAFLDPRNIGALKYDTIRALSDRYVDFVFLLALGMDARRNREIYAHPANRTVDELLGDPTWREQWARAEAANEGFQKFLARAFAKRMEALSYLSAGLETMSEFQRDDGLGLYHIAFFSRHKRGYSFWKQALKYASPQPKLPFE